VKTPEFRKMMGVRHMNSDGFTYVCGASKDGSSVRSATAATRRCIRNDKRSVRSQEMRQVFRDLDDSK
jgi:hypothetical protein